MGMSVYADLFFGLTGEEGHDLEWMCVKLGWAGKLDGNGDPDWDSLEDEVDCYELAKKNLPDGLVFGSHGCSEGEMAGYIALESSVKHAYWGSPTLVYPQSMVVTREHLEALEALGTRLGIGSPQWWLTASMYY